MNSSAPPPLPLDVRGKPSARQAILFLIGLMLLVTAPFVIWRVWLSSHVDKRLEEIARRGEPVDASDLARLYPKVSKEENAGIVWLRGVDAMVPKFTGRNDMPWHDVALPAHGGQLPADKLEHYSSLVASNQLALATFRGAAAMPRSHHEIDFSQTLAALMPHLPRLHSAFELLQLEAIVAIERNQPSRALEALLTGLQLAESIKVEPTLIANLLRFRLNETAVNLTEYILNRYRPNDQQLDSLSKAFSAMDEMTNLHHIFVCERAMMITLFKSPRSIGRFDGEDGVGEALQILGSPWVSATGFFARDFRYYLYAMSGNISIAGLADPVRFYARTNAEASALKAKEKLHILSGMVLPALTKVVEREVRHRAHARVAQAAVAVEQYHLKHKGSLPENLTSLVPAYLSVVPVDPFDGSSVRFKRLDSGYVVYSVGPDGKDDGGAEKVPSAPKSSPEDVTFIVERKNP